MRELLAEGEDETALERLRRAETIGEDRFLDQLEKASGQRLAPASAGHA